MLGSATDRYLAKMEHNLKSIQLFRSGFVMRAKAKEDLLTDIIKLKEIVEQNNNVDDELLVTSVDSLINRL